MRVVSLCRPAATLTVTREPHDFNRCRCDQWGRCLVDCPTSNMPMVSRWVTFDFACPSGVVGTRIAIAATEERCECLDESGERCENSATWRFDGLAGVLIRCDEHMWWEPHENGWTPLGVVVGSAKVEASYPIVSIDDETHYDHAVIVTDPYDDETLFIDRPSSGPPNQTDLSDQLPFADWSPGRFAWLLTDAAPCQERCPRCWGEGWDFTQPYAVCVACPVCDAKGKCDPVSWVSSGGRLPEWQAT